MESCRRSKAGLHPLAALGATGASFQPAIIPPTHSANTGVGDAMQRIGQGIANSGVDTSLQKLQLENMQLQNDQLRSQITGQNITNAKAFSNDINGQATVMPHGVEQYKNEHNYVRDPVDGSLVLQPLQFDQEPTFVENHLRFFNKSFPSAYQKKQLELALIKSGELDPYSQRLVWTFSKRSLGISHILYLCTILETLIIQIVVLCLHILKILCVSVLLILLINNSPSYKGG